MEIRKLQWKIPTITRKCCILSQHFRNKMLFFRFIKTERFYFKNKYTPHTTTLSFSNTYIIWCSVQLCMYRLCVIRLQFIVFANTRMCILQVKGNDVCLHRCNHSYVIWSHSGFVEVENFKEFCNTELRLWTTWHKILLIQS